ncbi:MAG: hypothetical protein JJU37_12510 [Balneolaceae bacterium]|nr:hypothetical protein [Balneolaceae bacterium]
MKSIKPIIYLTAIISLLSLSFFACKDNPALYEDEKRTIHDEFPDLPDQVQFTHLPTDLSQMAGFGPMGSLQGIPKMHGGFGLINYYTFPPNMIPVYAMGEGYIYNIEKDFRTVTDHWPPDVAGTDYDDFSLNIVYSKYAGGYYGHVSALSDEILEQAGEIKKGRGVHNRVRIKITPGQVLGYIGPHPGFDIGMYDYEREHYYANPSMYSPEYRSTVCYTDYLPADLRDDIWAINPRTAEPRCGRVAYDKEGTLAGIWFLEGTTDLSQWSRQLIFARHEIHGDRIAIADASPLLDGDGAQNMRRFPHLWLVKGNTPEPESITVESGLVLYEVADPWIHMNNEHADPEGTLLIQMLEPERIQYEYFEGKSANEVSGFTSNSRIYLR